MGGRQTLSRIDTSGEQAAKAVVYGLSQVLLAAEVTLGCQDGGVPQKKLYLLQFTAVHMAELCAGSPKIMRCEVVELQPPGTVPDSHTRRRFQRYRFPDAFRED